MIKQKKKHVGKLIQCLSGLALVGIILDFATQIINKKLGAKKRNGILIESVRGNGRTLLAHAIAGELEANLVTVSEEFFKDLSLLKLQTSRNCGLETQTVFIDTILSL